MKATPGIEAFLVDVGGTFFREVDRSRIAEALAGSRGPGRYSRYDQPTLYLSASVAGVDAAMRAYSNRRTERAVVPFEVAASDVLDLRRPEALAQVRAKCGDPMGNWRTALDRGATPASWRARDWIEDMGAAGLIDPSRHAPGLWHLVLFRWNRPDSPTVSPIGEAT